MATASSDATAAWVAGLSQGSVLGRLGRREAEMAATLLRLKSVVEITWCLAGVEAALLHPYCRVTVVMSESSTPASLCTQCGERRGLCPHTGAALLRFVELKPSFMRGGVGTVWRAEALQPFLPGSSGSFRDVDLTHLTEEGETLSALAFHLDQHTEGVVPLRREGDHLQLSVTQSTGTVLRVLVARHLLPLLLSRPAALPPLSPEGELAELRRGGRAVPVLRAEQLSKAGVAVVEPGYELPDGRFLSLGEARTYRVGDWLLIGSTIFEPARPGVTLHPLFHRGRVVLDGEAARSFLLHDHFALRPEPWYRADGELARLDRVARPTLTGVDVEEDAAGHLLLRPVYTAGGETLAWPELRELLARGVLRRGTTVVKPPTEEPFSAAGLKSAKGGLTGERLAVLRATVDAGVAVSTRSATLTRMLEALATELPALPEVIPGLLSNLRPYQRLGVAWLKRLDGAGLGALLADDMGLGKTHQAMALICLARAERPGSHSLVVCPRGVLEHWHRLLQDFAPGLPVAVFHGGNRSLPAEGDAAVVLTTYDIAVRSFAVLQAVDWDVAVFDEAQRVKNAHTKASRAARLIRARFKVALTGTPIENRLEDLWAIFDLIVPGYLGSERGFAMQYRGADAAGLARLRRNVAPFVLRRLKSEVLTELPEKSEEIRICELEGEQAELYRALEREGAAALRPRLADPDAEVPYMHVLALLTRLKQVCDHPALVDPRFASVTPGKLEVLDELLDEALESDNRVVVFSQYVGMIELLSRHLERRSIGHLVATGKTRDRAKVIARFNSGEHEPVLLASLLATGVGIDLTAASVVVHYDRWWNPAREAQATDRVHRIGQRRFVQVFKLLTADTVEERIEAILMRKLALAEDVVAPSEDLLHRLTREELLELLG